jgi:hypothetical protein
MTTLEDVMRLREMGNAMNAHLCPFCKQEVEISKGRMVFIISGKYFHFACFCKKYGCELRTVKQKEIKVIL